MSLHCRSVSSEHISQPATVCCLMFTHVWFNCCFRQAYFCCTCEKGSLCMRMRENWEQNIKTYTDHSKIQFYFVIQSECHSIVDLHTRQSWLHEKLLKGFKDRGRNVCLLTCPTYSCVAQCTLFCQNGDHDDTILTDDMSYSCQRVLV